MGATTERAYSGVYVEDAVGVTERHLRDVLQQRHLDGTVATVEQHDEVSTNRCRQLDLVL